ncbi:BrnT family toxin [Epibacterium sp. Ofav1-8]|uniref:BrnT family toxin n=1 Tax=Epibacterium sp. Ofav1-8 TaxID=2917735 RepID=UPI001EF6D799|nr:BrnT family toxin [Epibacterium sp. Ofav1-8]MCG7625949.1 BrnT family toxin [Epibacterium sp. Ofav1-8]
MQIDYDPKKRDSNIEKHGVDFWVAALIFEGETLTKEDKRKDYGEQRFISLGIVDGDVYSVTHTERDGRIRIISAWKGGRKEHDEYQNHIAR